MNGDTKLSELTIDECKVLINDHFMDSIDKLFWKNTKQLGVELTGKDITKVKDVHCIRKTYDNSQSCRVQKEKLKDVFLVESAKKATQWLMMIFALGFAAWAKFGK